MSDEIRAVLRSKQAPALYRIEQQLLQSDNNVEQVLIEALYDDAPTIRRNAAWLLRKFGTEKAVEWLADSLQDSDTRVRQFAAISLGQIGDARAVEPLAFALDDADVGVRLNVVRALGLIGEHTVVALLISVLKNNREDDEVQAQAARALGLMRAREAVSALFNALNRKSISIHTEAAMALARIGPVALPRLIEALQNDKKQYRQRRRAAAHAVGWMVGGKHLAEYPDGINIAMEALIAEAGSIDVTVRQEFAQALGRTHDIRALEPLTIGLLYDVPSVRRSSTKALLELAQAKIVPMAAAVEPLIEALNDQDIDVRYTAIEALGHVRDARAIPPLFGLSADRDPDARYRAIVALGDTGDESVVKPVSRLLRDRDTWTRRCAALALGRLRHPKGLKPLIVGLSDPEADVRLWAALALAQIGEPSVIPNLEEHRQDPVPKVRHAIEAALRELGAG